MVIDHLCFAVKSLDIAIERWNKTYGYQMKTKIIFNSRQMVNVVFLEKENSLDIKLIEPVNKFSPVYRFTQHGGGFHHLCFKCDNLEEEIEKLQLHDLRVLASPQPGEAFKNEKIAFLLDKSGLNIELIDTDKRAGLIDDR